MLIEGIYLRHLTSLLFVREVINIEKVLSQSAACLWTKRQFFPLARKRETYGVLISIFLGDFFQFGEQMRTEEIHRQSVSQFIDSREGDEAELSTCELTIREGARFFFFFSFLFLFLKREREFSLRE